MSVDVIGKDGVSKFISSSKLTKFVIYRQNARSGSTPVFDGSHCNTCTQVVSTFQLWADNILTANPGNNMPYEMLLFSKVSDIDDDLDPDDTEDTPRKQKAGKMKKIRFSFCLAGYHHGQSSQVNVQDAIRAALEERDRQDEMKLLRAEMAELKAQMSGEDDDEDDDKPSPFWQAVEMIKNGNTHKQQAAQISGEAGTAKRYTDEEKKRIQDALKTLRKHSNNLPRDLELLAKFADKNPTMFANYMQTLRNSV